MPDDSAVLKPKKIGMAQQIATPNALVKKS